MADLKESSQQESGVWLEQPAMTLNVSAERNSKGWNISASVLNAPTVALALATLDQVIEGLTSRFHSA